MDKSSLLELLAQIQRGEVAPESAAERLAVLPFEDIGHARIDHHRDLRTGLPEVIYAAGKSPVQTAEIFARMAAAGPSVLATRATPETAAAVRALVPGAVYNPTALTLTLSPAEHGSRTSLHCIAVLCAGTSDLPVAEEAATTAEHFGVRVIRLYDVGVAGVHRLLAVRHRLAEADCVIVCAGMEGALPSVVGGLIGVPVIAVPTSVGYGASFGGAAALLGMLNSCSPNVSVVNIDNGFGAAYTATLIARSAHRANSSSSPASNELEVEPSRMPNMERRDFLKTATAASLAVGASAAAAAPTAAVAKSTRPQSPNMIYRQLGTTGETVSAIGLGGFHIGKQAESAESVALIRKAIDAGITFMDNCWDYNNGTSEVRMGQALREGYRDKVFLMTKIDGRTKSEYTKQLEESMSRLRTDTIDLVQFHECIRLEDPDRIFGPGGALEAAVAAREQGKIRYIGFTGHKDPIVHLRMLEMAQQHNFHFDTVQMPVNVMDAHFRSFTREVMPVAIKQGIGVLAMKTFGDAFILSSGTVQPIEALHYSLTQPVSVVITGIDSDKVLDQALEAARTFKPLSEAQITVILDRTKSAALTGKFELFKTTPHFDGTANNPTWLGNPTLS